LWLDPKPVSWHGSGNSPYSTYGPAWVVATHIRKHSSGPIKPLAQFAETRMRRTISAKVTRSIATSFALSTTAHAGVSLTGRVALRALPVVGWALLAYDVYTVGDALYDWYKSDN
jgi:hypothetical protein